MDYALLAATAMGAVALFLMLPRERAPLVRLGAIMGVMALGALFLFLIQASMGGGGTKESSWGGPPGYFYLFAFIMIASAVGVICQPRPVYAALNFVLVTLAGAGMFVLLQSEFMAIVLVIIYAGAILVTYVFVIMLASQGSVGTGAGGGAVVAPAYDRTATSPLISVAVAFVLIGAVLQMLYPGGGGEGGHGMIARSTERAPDPLMAANLDIPLAGAASRPVTEAPSNVQVLGANLYSQYAFSLELAGILLTIALVGAVVIARKNTEPTQSLGTGKLPTE